MKIENIVLRCEASVAYQKGCYEVTLSDVQDSDDAAIAQYKKYVEDQAIAMASDLAAALPSVPKPSKTVVNSTVAPRYNGASNTGGFQAMPHKNGPASPKALAYAHRLGYNGPDNISSGQCNQIINQLKANPNGAAGGYQQAAPAQAPQQYQQNQDYINYDYPDDQNY